MSAIAVLLSILVMATDPVGPRAALERARVCWAALDPDCAEGGLGEARAGIEGLDPDEQREVLRLSAEVALSTERSGDAERWLLELLARDPRFSPTGWPDPWLAVLERARKVAPDRLPPILAVTVASETPSGRPLEVVVRADDPSGVARCELVIGASRVALLAADGLTFRGDVARDRVKPPELAFHVEAVDRAGNVARWPESGEQRVIVTPPPASTPITRQWWFWTAIGAVVVGGAVALVWALGGDDPVATDKQGGIAIELEEPR